MTRMIHGADRRQKGSNEWEMISRIMLVLLFLTLLTTEMNGAFDWTEIGVPVRDGAVLAADLYTTDSTSPKPVILIQTPYNKNLYHPFGVIPAEAGGRFPLDSNAFNYVVLDWRGFYGSKDDAASGYDRGLDGFDAVEWIAAQPWCNGKVGTWGPSALGLIQYQTARHHPPHLVCSVPLVKDFRTKYTDYYYGGEFRRAHVETLQKLGFISVDFILTHPTNDPLTRAVELGTDYASDISVPMLVIGGWFDHYPDDVLRSFNDLVEKSDPAVRGKHRLLFGPWTHSGIDQGMQGEITYPDAAGVASEEGLRFFHYYLLGEENGWDGRPVVRYYRLGADRWESQNSWRSGVGSDSLSLYLRKGGLLSLNGIGGPDFEPDQFRYDPRDPSPTVGGSIFDPFGQAPTGPLDQRAKVESRNDLLLYTTEPLQNDLDITGPISVELYISTDREDSDIAIRLCDVYPDGRSILLTQGIRRLRFRNGFRPQDTALVIPGETYPVRIDLQNLAIRFRAGHRLRMIVTGSDYPHFDLNPNTAAPLYQSDDTLIATTSIYVAPGEPSRVVMYGTTISDVKERDEVNPSGSPTIVSRGTGGGEALRLRLDHPDDIELSLCDLLGRTAGENRVVHVGTGEASIDLTGMWDIPSGLYFLSVSIDGQNLFLPLYHFSP